MLPSLAILLLMIAPYSTSAHYSPPDRSNLDEICCPTIHHNRTKALGIIWNPDSRLRKVAYLYQSSTYKQILEEIQCQFPNVEVPSEVQNRDSRCNGQCEQLHGSQLMITLQPSPLKFRLTDIEVKIGCTFVAANDESNK